jgi:hypothetical protein
VLRQIPWDQEAKRWSGIERLKNRYANEARKRDDQARFTSALKILQRFAVDVLSSDVTAGWAEDDLRQVDQLFSSDATVVAAIGEKFRKKSMFGRDPRGMVGLGASSAKLTADEFGEWAPEGNDFTRGAYLRAVWNEVYARCSDARIATV